MKLNWTRLGELLTSSLGPKLASGCRGTARPWLAARPRPRLAGEAIRQGMGAVYTLDSMHGWRGHEQLLTRPSRGDAHGAMQGLVVGTVRGRLDPRRRSPSPAATNLRRWQNSRSSDAGPILEGGGGGSKLAPWWLLLEDVASMAAPVAIREQGR